LAINCQPIEYHIGRQRRCRHPISYGYISPRIDQYSTFCCVSDISFVSCSATSNNIIRTLPSYTACISLSRVAPHPIIRTLPSYTVELIFILAMGDAAASLPGGKELVQLLMSYEIYEREVLGGQVKKYVKVTCPNCNVYKKNNPVSQGWTNYATHFSACVGSSEKLGKLVYERNLLQKEEGEGDMKKQTASTASQHVTVPSDKERSTSMWLQLITLKNMPAKLAG
jgi:hypothetical protein